jgi:GNAT superfamily N-acetyltransferase
MADLIDSARALSNLNNLATSSDEDTTIAALISAVSNSIENYCWRTFASTSYDELYPGNHRRELVLRNYPTLAVERVAYAPLGVLRVTNTSPSNQRAWRRLRRRPPIALDILRVAPSAWPLFAPHHYLSAAIANSAVCFVASWQDRPVAFSAWLPFVGAGPKTRREHRTVTLPDYQGVGIGNALSDFVASLWAGLGYRAISTTTHPAMIRARLRSPSWQMHRKPSFAASHEGRLRHATTRLTAGFRYVGPALPCAMGRALLETKSQ